jgi:hypothetical protein
MKIRFLLAVSILALVLAPSALGGGTMFVGAAEDQARSLDPVVTKSRMDLAALAGLDAVRMTTFWTPGQREVNGDDLKVLRNAASAAELDGIRLIVSVYQPNYRSTPLTLRARKDFAAFTASIARKVPAVADFIVGNEPNLSRFWMPQFDSRGRNAAAIAYERLLATTYDAIKRVNPDANVIGGALAPRGQDKARARRQTHSPSTFIPDLGRAYRDSHRRRRIMDMFAIHPYLIPSRLAPTTTNPRNTSIGISDYDKVRKLLKRAFDGTAQPGFGLPILYDEFGYQTQIPGAKTRFYRHLKSAAAKDAISEKKQAAYYKKAFAIAQCQPTVAGMLIFHVTDERDAKAWQSGVYYADRTAKSSRPVVRAAALRAQAGSLVQCSRGKVRTGLGRVVFHEPPVDEPSESVDPDPQSDVEKPALRIDLTCTAICRYEARVIRVDTGAVALSTSGTAAKGKETVKLPAEDLRPATYQYAFRASAAGKPGSAVTRYSRPFTIKGAVPEPPPLDGPLGPPLPPLRTLSSLPTLPTLLPTVPAPPPAAR